MIFSMYDLEVPPPASNDWNVCRCKRPNQDVPVLLYSAGPAERASTDHHTDRLSEPGFDLHRGADRLAQRSRTRQVGLRASVRTHDVSGHREVSTGKIQPNTAARRRS